MNLEALLKFTGATYLDDRTELLDGEPDSLWSNETLTRFFNEYQTRLCRRAWALVDVGHAQAGVIVLVEAKTVYRLHKAVLRVMDATPEDAVVPLAHVTDQDMTGWTLPDADFFDVNEVTARTPGATLAFSTDAGTRSLRVTPAPAAAQAGLKVNLKVARLPVCDLRFDKLADCPEVDEQWHMHMCYFAAGRALTMPTTDADQKVEGRRLLDECERTIREARQERERAWAAEARPHFCSTTASL